MKKVDIAFVKDEVSGEHDLELTDGQAKAIADAANANIDGLGLDSVESLIDDALFATQDLYVSCGDCGAESDDYTLEGTSCTSCHRGVVRLRIRRDDSADICTGCGQARRDHPVKLLSGTFGMDGHRFFIHWSEITTAWAVREDQKARRSK